MRRHSALTLLTAGLLAANTPAAASANAEPPDQFGVCSVAREDMAFINPLRDAQRYADAYGTGRLRFDDRAQLTVVTGPAHGRFARPDATDDRTRFHYRYDVDAASDFAGNDRIVVDITATGGGRLRIHYTLSVDQGQPWWVMDASGNKVTDPARCPKADWRIVPGKVPPH
jgi:hypothetical protein